MSWTPYHVVLRLESQMHVGWGKVGNLQRTRPYLPGRALWGALTERLTRDVYVDRYNARDYQEIGERVNQTLAMTYFYVALRGETGGYVPQWPWEAAATRFAQRLLGSYPSTALVYPQQGAAEGTLHEIEYIAPRTLDRAASPVYLRGYLFAHTDAPAGWQTALGRLQIGGERGYGWGWVTPVAVQPLPGARGSLFDLQDVIYHLDGARPQIELPARARLLAHASADDPRAVVRGPLEPLVGREWATNQEGTAGQQVVFNAVCFAPGACVDAAAPFEIGSYGMWRLPPVDGEE
jgi:hypothetical protein